MKMSRRTNVPLAFSKVSAKGQTAIPGEVRPSRSQAGRYAPLSSDASGILLDKLPSKGAEADDCFATFSEWFGEADEKAYAGL
jgi:hypothetical protein